MNATRGRRRKFNENDVVDQAVDVFWRHGYRSATTRHLEAALGMSPSSLYNAFGSKQGLFEAAMDRYEARVGQTLLAPLEASDAGVATVHGFFDMLVRTVTSGGRAGCMVINLMAEEGSVDRRLVARAATYRRRIRLALEAALRNAGSEGARDQREFEVRAEVLFGITLGINLLARTGSRNEIDRLTSSAHALLDDWHD